MAYKLSRRGRPPHNKGDFSQRRFFLRKSKTEMAAWLPLLGNMFKITFFNHAAHKILSRPAGWEGLCDDSESVLKAPSVIFEFSFRET